MKLTNDIPGDSCRYECVLRDLYLHISPWLALMFYDAITLACDMFDTKWDFYSSQGFLNEFPKVKMQWEFYVLENKLYKYKLYTFTSIRARQGRFLIQDSSYTRTIHNQYKYKQSGLGGN